VKVAIGRVGRIGMSSGLALLRDRQVVFWNFGFFTLLLVLFLGVLSGGDPAVQVSLTAALVTISVMANALLSVGVGLATARERGVFRRFATTPIPGWTVAAGVVTARMLIVMASGSLLVLLARAVFGVSWSGGTTGWLTVVVAGTAAFSAIGFFIAATARAHAANAFANLALIPMMALGGTTLPVAMLPHPFSDVSSALPTRAMVDGLVASFVAGAGFTDLLPQQMLLLGWTIVAGTLGAVAWRRRSP